MNDRLSGLTDASQEGRKIPHVPHAFEAIDSIDNRNTLRHAERL